MKFKQGDLVVLKELCRANTSFHVQKVAVILDSGDILLEHYGAGYQGEIHEEPYDAPPKSRSYREGLTRHQEDELFTTDEAIKAIEVLEIAKDKLEAEFAAIRDQVRDKLAQAAKLAEEATAILVKCDKDYEDVLQESIPLYTALVDGGWRHSTLRCKVGR